MLHADNGEVVFGKLRVDFWEPGWMDVYCDAIDLDTPLATFVLDPSSNDTSPPYAQITCRLLIYSPTHGEDPLAWADYYRGETVIEMDSFAQAEEIPDQENPLTTTEFFHFPYEPIASWRYGGPMSLDEEAEWLDKLMRGAQ